MDVAVTLTNGSYHSVDSSEQAFRQAARLAMQAGIPQCEPQLLEPIMAVQVWMPQAFTAKVMQALTGRRGQVLGYSNKEGWPAGEQIEAYLPQAEMHDFVVELRSLTMGTGGFHWQFDHLQEMPGETGRDDCPAPQKSLGYQLSRLGLQFLKSCGHNLLNLRLLLAIARIQIISHGAGSRLEFLELTVKETIGKAAVLNGLLLEVGSVAKLVQPMGIGHILSPIAKLAKHLLFGKAANKLMDFAAHGEIEHQRLLEAFVPVGMQAIATIDPRAYRPKIRWGIGCG